MNKQGRWRTLRVLVASTPLLLGAAPGGAGEPLEEVVFLSHGVGLSGSIAFPSGRIHAAVVFIHGSGPQERSLAWAERFAGDGVAALVYDKRGVGKSGGIYEGEQTVSERNLSLLADDAVSALEALRSQPRLEGVPVGLAGISQAGWIAPLAAERSRRADFLVLWSGPVCKVSEEDIFSRYTADADAEIVPSFEEALRSRTEEYVWPDFLGRDTDPRTSLASLSIPGLWIYGENDGSIPADLSIARLGALRRAGRDYDYVLLSGLGHDNMDATFAVATDWIKRRLK